MDMNGKTAVVTGAASGMGQATAVAAKSAGAKVIALDRAPIGAAVDVALQYDQSDPASIDAAAAAIDGPVDALFNCAGIFRGVAPHDVLIVNFLGMRHFTEAMIPKIAEGGSVTTIASLGGIAWRGNVTRGKALIALTSFDQAENFMAEQGVEPVAAYGVTKETIVMWTQICADAYMDRNIRFNCVSPGTIQTPLWDVAMASAGPRGKQILETTPRIADPEEVAPLMMFLASDGAGFINGTDVPIDGGVAARFNRKNFGF